MAPKPTRHHPATTPRRANPNLGPRLRNNSPILVPNENGKFDVSAEGIPAKTTIKISYTDGYKKPTHYSDIFELNAVLLFGTAKPKTPVHRIQTDLQNIHQELKSLREGCGFPEANTSNKY